MEVDGRRPGAGRETAEVPPDQGQRLRPGSMSPKTVTTMFSGTKYLA